MPYTTEERQQALEALARCGNKQAAADALGWTRSRVRRVVEEIAAEGERFTIGGISASPQRDGLSPYVVKGVSTYFNADGEQRGQWVKTTLDQEKAKAALDAAYGAMAAELPRLEPIPGPSIINSALLTLYTFTDYHLGALCWHREGGADWDVRIAERTGDAAMQALVDGAPASDTAIVNIQGDFTHADGPTPATPTSGHILDADSRFGKVADIAIRMIRRLVAKALEKHARVHLLICEGNHDLVTSLWLRKMFAALYENEPRVTVDDSDLPYYAFQWGSTMLGFHHGHLRKNDQLPALFAAQFPVMWGATTKRYAHCGHRHHVEEKEHSGMTVVQHPTLAARDAYAARGGWIADRQATAITYHKAFGRVATNSVCPEMLEAA